MNRVITPTNVHPPLGAYSHAIEIPPGARWLAIAGQVGVDRAGKVRTGIRQQAEQAFRNVVACARAAGMRKEDLVRITVYLTDARHVEAYRAARNKVLGEDNRPASTLLVIDALARPELLIEVEAWAARA